MLSEAFAGGVMFGPCDKEPRRAVCRVVSLIGSHLKRTSTKHSAHEGAERSTLGPVQLVTPARPSWLTF